MTDRTPIICDRVHYVSYGTPGGEFASRCRAAIVADVYQNPDEGDQPVPPQVCALAVLNPTGLFFHDCQQDEAEHRGGTWHWPHAPQVTGSG